MKEILSKELENIRWHPQVKEAGRLRKELSRNRYCPRYHFSAPEGRLNDPNGLCFWKGLWHLFYQAFPKDGSPISWGHTVSKDLIHWMDLPYALRPGPEQACWSGATLAEENRVIAMYYGNEYGDMVAVADDPLLLDWEKLTGKCVIPRYSEDGTPLPYTAFDPCIWKRGEWYYALSGGSRPHPSTGRNMRAEYLFRSKDLIHWEYRHDLYDRDFAGVPDMDGACPYFWPIGEKGERDILLHFSHLNGGQFMLGNFDGQTEKFEICNAGSFSSGSWFAGGVHAPSATPDGKGGIITVFNINQAISGAEGGQIMSLPRRLTLYGEKKDLLAQAPAGDYTSLRYNHQHVEEVDLPANEEVVLSTVQGDVMEIEAVFAPDNVPALEMNVLRSPGKEEYTRIAFLRQRGDLHFETLGELGWNDAHESVAILDAMNGSMRADVLALAPETVAWYLAPGEPLRLHVFIDKSIVEVFVNDTVCLSARVYPSREDSVGVSLRSLGKNSRLLSLDAWHMRCIYEDEAI